MTRRQKFHTDDINQCLHNKSGSRGVPNVNLFDFMFLLVDYGKFCDLLRMSYSKTPMFFQRRIYSCRNIDCFVIDPSCLHMTFVAFCLSLVNNR